VSLRMSTRSRYGLRLMIALGVRYREGITLMKDVSRGEGISEKYLGQIIIPLKAAGLVSSQRGSHGGYALAKPPEQVTVKDIVEAIEGDIVPVPCTDDSENCGRASTCAAAKVWKRLTDDMKKSLSAFTLADLVRDARDARESGPNYEI
jgi:Rrf2 family protein